MKYKYFIPILLGIFIIIGILFGIAIFLYFLKLIVIAGFVMLIVWLNNKSKKK